MQLNKLLIDLQLYYRCDNKYIFITQEKFMTFGAFKLGTKKPYNFFRRLEIKNSVKIKLRLFLLNLKICFILLIA